MADYSNPVEDEAVAQYRKRREQELYDFVVEKMGLGWDDTTSFIEAVREIIRDSKRL